MKASFNVRQQDQQYNYALVSVSNEPYPDRSFCRFCGYHIVYVGNIYCDRSRQLMNTLMIVSSAFDLLSQRFLGRLVCYAHEHDDLYRNRDLYRIRDAVHVNPVRYFSADNQNKVL